MSRRKVDLGPAFPIALYHATKDTIWANDDKEVEANIIPEAQGGPGYSETYIHKEWPKSMSHATEVHVQAKDAAHGEELKKRGYSFEPVHPNRKGAAVDQGPGTAAVASQMDQSMQVPILTQQVQQLMAAAAAKEEAKAAPRKRGPAKPKKEEAA